MIFVHFLRKNHQYKLIKIKNYNRVNHLPVLEKDCDYLIFFFSDNPLEGLDFRGFSK